MNRIAGHLIPDSLKPKLRTLRAKWYEAFRDLLIAPSSLHNVGSSSEPDFVRVGDEFLRYFKDLCRLRGNERVLDIGSGTGRLAKPLASYLEKGGYEGIDIVEDSIKWCQKIYAERYPNFHFQFVDIYNKNYNPSGKYRASEYRFPFEDSAFDLVFLTSVFTHMLPVDVDNYLSEIRRVLKAGGRCLITYFLLNSESKRFVDQGVSPYSFKHELPGCRVENGETPEDVVAYEESIVRDWYEKYNLKIVQPISYGKWCGRNEGVSWQDIVIAWNSDK